MNFRNPEGQVARWIELLDTYDFIIQHRAGRIHSNADGLSRRPCDACNQCERNERRELTDDVSRDDADVESTDKDAHGRNVDISRVAAIRRSQTSSQNLNWLSPMTDAEKEAAQKADPDISMLIKWKGDGKERPKWADISSESRELKSYWSQWKRLELFNGVLYRNWVTNNGTRVEWHLVIPKSMRENIMEALHSSLVAGHLGVKKTLHKIRARFYWPNCERDVENYCRRCDICQSRKSPPKLRKVPMKIYNVGAPLERIALDILGPLPETDKGNKYILVIADYFTKWTEAFPLPNQEAVTVVSCLVSEFFCRYGIPRQIHTDQGRNFESLVFAEMCKLFDIDKTRTSPLHPQSDGMVERFNKTVEAMLAMSLEDQTEWDTKLPYVMMAYRSSVHESTGYSPNMLMLGREVEMPIDVLIGRPKDEAEVDVAEYVMQLQKDFEQAHQSARHNNRKATLRQKKNYDHRTQSKTFQQGDAVWLYDASRKKGVCPKFQCPWKGPFQVRRCLSDVTYEIQMSPWRKLKIVHVDRLKKYEGNQKLDWVKPTSVDSSAGEVPVRAEPSDVERFDADPDSPDEIIVNADCCNNNAVDAVCNIGDDAEWGDDYFADAVCSNADGCNNNAVDAESKSVDNAECGDISDLADANCSNGEQSSAGVDPECAELSDMSTRMNNMRDAVRRSNRKRIQTNFYKP